MAEQGNIDYQSLAGRRQGEVIVGDHAGFRAQYGPWACVAGASMGIGLAFSNEIAARGCNVVMVARGEELLREKAAEVRAAHGVETLAVPADLASPTIRDTLDAATAGLEIGLFVYNATVAPNGKFVDVPLDYQLLSVAVNCATPVALCNLFAPPMVARGRGGIGMVSSMGGAQGSIQFGTYNAGKAFEWILAETLWAELGEHGVHVNNIFVGPTASPNYLAFKETLDPSLCNKPDSEDPLDRARARLMDPSPPEEVAVALLDQLADGPVCFSREEDAIIFRKTMDQSRADAVRTWVGLQQTSLRIPERQAR
jgi:short-subunit dehydrogenase